MTKINGSIQIALNTKVSCSEKLFLLLKIVILMMNFNILYDFNTLYHLLKLFLISLKKEKIKIIYYLPHLFYSFSGLILVRCKAGEFRSKRFL